MTVFWTHRNLASAMQFIGATGSDTGIININGSTSGAGEWFTEVCVAAYVSKLTGSAARRDRRSVRRQQVDRLGSRVRRRRVRARPCIQFHEWHDTDSNSRLSAAGRRTAGGRRARSTFPTSSAWRRASPSTSRVEQSSSSVQHTQSKSVLARFESDREKISFLLLAHWISEATSAHFTCQARPKSRTSIAECGTSGRAYTRPSRAPALGGNQTGVLAVSPAASLCTSCDPTRSSSSDRR